MKQKIFALLLCLVIMPLSLILTGCQFSWQHAQGKFIYRKYDDGYCVSVDLKKNEQSLTLPSYFRGKKVVRFDQGYGNVNGNIETLIIPKTITSLAEGVISKINGLMNIQVDENNPVYNSGANCNAIIETSSNTLVCGCKNTIIPTTVVKIGEWAFSFCAGLSSVTIPNGVTEIGTSAFRFCTNLESIIIPTSIIIPINLDSLCSDVFYGCNDTLKIYYAGTSESIDTNWHNNFKIYYYSDTQPSENDKFWHYVNGVPTIW